jgi:hypothetical protein
MKTLLTCALAMVALATVRASDFEIKGTTSGVFTNSGTTTETTTNATFAAGTFDVTTFAGTASIGGTATENLGQFTVPIPASNIVSFADTFTLTVTFTAPPGAGPGSYTANIAASISKTGAGSYNVTWSTPTEVFGFPGGSFTLTLNNLSITPGNSSYVTGAITAATTVPDGGSAVALLGVALAGIEGARRIFRARKA